MEISDLWAHGNSHDWELALERYWDFVKPSNLTLERNLEQLTSDRIDSLGPEGWYKFLHDEYFRWKYTAPNRYATTTHHLRTYATTGSLDSLFSIRTQLLTVDVQDIKGALALAHSIKGLGIAGASGLLALMYPHHFGTVDQFAVKALRNVKGIQEADAIKEMNPEDLSLEDGALLVHMMRRRALENNRRFATSSWTPRKIDKVLWTYGRNTSPIPVRTPERASSTSYGTVANDREIPHYTAVESSAMKIPEKVTSAFRKRTDAVLTSGEIKSAVMKAYPGTVLGSIIPSDYCYNMVNKDPASFKVHLFTVNTDGTYNCLGLHYPYEGPIYWKKKKVGIWENGLPRLWEDPRRKP